MKGGLAVMLELADDHAGSVDRSHLVLLRLRRGGRADSGLLTLWERRPDLLAGDAAILGEPTSALVEAGCQGTMRVLVPARRARPYGPAFHRA